MNPDTFANLKYFDFINYFGIIKHSFNFDNSQRITGEILDDIEVGFKRIKWRRCEQNSAYINFSEKN